MPSTNSSANIFKGALVSSSLLEGSTVIPFQYNPASMQRSLTPNMSGGEEQDRTLSIMYKGPPTQTINVSIEFDAATGLNSGASTEVQNGVYAQLAALELLLTPTTTDLLASQALLATGVMEITPFATPSIYFVWGPARVLPVKITQYAVTEELFDAHLNPIQATIALTMRVLNCNDVSVTNKAYQQYITYQQKMEQIAPLAHGSSAVTGASFN
ncbi:MAG: hypothetical protein ACI9LM_002310 [Alteromonadaceae bacterium]|jgi:hypothetical protein